MSPTPLKILKQAVAALKRQSCDYCLIGGHAASLYRSQARLTNDVDFALVAKPAKRSRQVAEQVISALGLKPAIGFIPKGKDGGRRKSICFVTSTPPAGALTGIIDILLPEMPWIAPAVERAHYNQIDLGFSKVPVITPEDLIIAKCFALAQSPDRFQDLDDLKELLSKAEEFDLDYLAAQMNSLKLAVPELVRKFAPAILRK